MFTRSRPEAGPLDLGGRAPGRTIVERLAGPAPSPTVAVPAGSAGPSGRIEHVAAHLHLQVGVGAGLDDLVQVLLAESGSSMRFLSELLTHCTAFVHSDTTWQRVVTAVQATMGEPRLRAI